MDYQTAIDIFRYDPVTGFLHWANHIPRKYFDSERGWKILNSRQAGTHTCSLDTGGYLQIRWKNKAYRAHRIIWLIHFGVWPSHHIDHKDHDRQNNKINNFRDVTQATNNANKKNNKSGYSGVFFNHKSTNRPWMVQVFTKGKYVTQKSFADIPQAVAHRDAVRSAHGLTQL